MGRLRNAGSTARDAAMKAAAEAKRQGKAYRRRHAHASCLIEDKIDRSRQGVPSNKE